MAIESSKCARQSLLRRSTIGPIMVGPGKKFSNLRRMENIIVRLIFANTVFHKRFILLVC